jgi:hypothetical protein
LLFDFSSTSSDICSFFGLVCLEELSRGDLRPYHFSSKTPYDRLTLEQYSENWFI